MKLHLCVCWLTENKEGRGWIMCNKLVISHLGLMAGHSIINHQKLFITWSLSLTLNSLIFFSEMIHECYEIFLKGNNNNLISTERSFNIQICMQLLILFFFLRVYLFFWSCWKRGFKNINKNEILLFKLQHTLKPLSLFACFQWFQCIIKQLHFESEDISML